MLTSNKCGALERQWLEGRQRGIGSSESPVIVLGQIYRTKPIDIYLGKVTPIGPKEDNPHFRRGHTYEPLALALFERQSGIRVYAPETDEDRYQNFQRWDPERPWIFSNFDGLCEDGWVAEVKSPMQRVADRITNEGIQDYHLVQCHHHNHIANVAPNLPHLGSRWRGQIKGTRLIIYEVEQVQLQVYDIPYDQAFIDDLLERCRCFWEDHVVPRRPPHSWEPQPKRIPKRGGRYELVEGQAWEDAAQELFFAKQLQGVSKRRYEIAKQVVVDAMLAAGKDRIMLPSGAKFLRGKQASRTLDKARLLADHPGVDLDAYMAPGEPYETFRSYGATDVVDAAETMESGIGALHEQLTTYAGRQIDADVAASEFDRLRNQAELYSRMLHGELDQLEAAMSQAYAACLQKIKGATNA